MVVGRLLSYWEGNFSGAMLNFGRVTNNNSVSLQIGALQGKVSQWKGWWLFHMRKPVPAELWDQGDFESEITLDEWIFLHGFMGKSNSCSWKTWVHLKKHPTSFVFFSPFEKWESSPRGEHKRYLKPPPRKGISFLRSWKFRYLQVKNHIVQLHEFFSNKIMHLIN